MATSDSLSGCLLLFSDEMNSLALAFFPIRPQLASEGVARRMATFLGWGGGDPGGGGGGGTSTPLHAAESASRSSPASSKQQIPLPHLLLSQTPLPVFLSRGSSVALYPAFGSQPDSLASATVRLTFLNPGLAKFPPCSEAFAESPLPRCSSSQSRTCQTFPS